MSGIYVINIHGRNEYYNFIDNKPYILGKSKSKDCWIETILTEDRIKRAKKIDEFEAFRRLK